MAMYIAADNTKATPKGGYFYNQKCFQNPGVFAPFVKGNLWEILDAIVKGIYSDMTDKSLPILVVIMLVRLSKVSGPDIERSLGRGRPSSN
ncbi:hypothetical protein AXJ18_gp064 [Streptomyces phage Jay2Jay]|uniref:Uncharacterized protein n=2 Tax=Samistivirus jay2jay TaxID=2560786 RepID=A0A0A0RMG3_9CAUD|nr:hypothetical protein AXJ18_gp002 [Streptomyces phage Jay2Jay]YP_009225937.1 hypothetical protein AXJ18_gp064 [Streptomyces phage Jay2Jay]ASN73077.1 hypothetical protein SEA_WARPY_2 [Streptomyces phage Warpy]AIW02501.1 hypothetical protein PBI_JAY2JAY_2 [Streptomyces phage Jay2Jay]AIW02710.1 hypothetical protein PBI_JAY2JAY_257 [Streptomyces phage Jay2Jay]ASN73284.1 hypothetical protein SEA_WARPY_254 [Streptomyces phage Warpy]